MNQLSSKLLRCWWKALQLTGQMHGLNWNLHPYEFYQKQGFVIIGVMPDANGLGKPDILMAKSVVR